MTDDVKQLIRNTKSIILDIEGTTTPIDFVKKELFPYAKEHLKEFLIKNWNDSEVQDSITEIVEQSIKDSKEDLAGFIPIPVHYQAAESAKNWEEFQKAIVSNLLWQMSIDRKTTGLKKIQGLIWQEGYKSGQIKGQFYDDAPQAMKSWVSSGKDLYIYSSGSKQAQVDLFHYSVFGDLREYIKDHFDTTIGGKFDPESYRKICEHIGRTPEEVVFLSDHPREIWASTQIGLKGVLIERIPGQPFPEFDESVLNCEVTKLDSFCNLY